MTVLAVDEIVSVSGDYGFVSTVTLNKVTSSSPTLAVILFCAANDNVPVSVTYGGQAMTVTQNGLTALQRLLCATLINPPSGAQNIVFNFSGGYIALAGACATWTGEVTGVSAVLSPDEILFTTPTLSIAKAASSAMMGMFVSSLGEMDFIGAQYLGDGTEIHRYSLWAVAKQNPAEGSGAMDWEGYDALDDAYFPLRGYGATVEITTQAETTLPTTSRHNITILNNINNVRLRT